MGVKITKPFVSTYIVYQTFVRGCVIFSAKCVLLPQIRNDLIKNMKRQYIFLLFFLLTTVVFGQNTTIDSLERRVKEAKGNEKIHTLHVLAETYLNSSTQKAFETAQKAYYYSTFTNSAAILSDSYFTLGVLHYRTSSFDSAMFYMNKALKTSETNEQTAVILDNIGKVYKDLSIYDSSLYFHNQALRLQQVLGNHSSVSDCYKNIGNVYMQMGKFEEAIHNYETALEERKYVDAPHSTADLYNNISSAYVGMHKYADALSYLMSAADIQAQEGDKVGEAYTLNGIGNFYFRLKVYDKAQEYYTKSLELRKSLGDKNDIAATLFNIGTVHRDLDNFKEAIKYYGQALELRSQTDNREAQALILNAIGGLYKNQKKYKESISFYQNALEMNQAIGSKKAIASTYERLGMIYRDTCIVAKNKELFKQATTYYAKASQTYQEIGDSLNTARIYTFQGNLNKEMGNYQTAKELYNTAKSFYADNLLGKAYTTYNQGKLAQVAPYIDATSAESYYQEALNLAKLCEEKSLICDVVYSLYSLMKQQGNNAKALEYYEQYVNLSQSLENDKNKERITELEFEADIKMLEQINENQQLKIREEERKQEQIHIYIVILVCILLGIIVFSILLYRQYSQKRLALKRLKQKQLEVESAYQDVKIANETLEKKNNQILDSLMYAKHIQTAILPSHEEIAKHFPQNFILYLPKDLVSGDFYWLSTIDDSVFFAVVDCTGHGVPGACMSMIGNTLLNQIINEQHVTSPAEILNVLDREVIINLRQNEDKETQEDGMTVSLIRYDKKTSELTFAGAGQKMILEQDGKTDLIATSLFSIGGMHATKQNEKILFEEKTISVSQGTSIYLFSDGFVDQFGGDNNERFTSRRFIEMIHNMQDLDMSEQFINLSKQLDTWKGSEKQIDDILVVGIKF